MAEQQRPPVPGKVPEHIETISNRSQLLGKYAHQIQNHLTIILGNCDLALTPGADTTIIAAQLGNIRTSALTISNLTKAIEPLEN